MKFIADDELLRSKLEVTVADTAIFDVDRRTGEVAVTPLTDTDGSDAGAAWLTEYDPPIAAIIEHMKVTANLERFILLFSS